MPSGCYTHTEEQARKISAALRGRKKKPFTPEHRRKIQEAASLPRMPYGYSRNINFAAAAEKAHERLRGSHGFGCMARGRSDHPSARGWILQSPEGTLYSLDNLREWCRLNEALFPEDAPLSTRPLHERAYSGLISNKNKGRPYWKGWKILVVGEFKSGGN